MTGKSSARSDKSGKNKISSVDTAGISNVFAQEGILATKHEILKENHENLEKDYKSLEESFKQVNELNEIMKLHLQNQTKELDAKNQRLLKDLEKERSEKVAYMKEMKRMESEKEAMINDLRIKNQEILIAKEKEAEELKMMVNKYGELKDRFGMAELECSYLKSLFDAENLTGLGGNDVAFKNDVDDPNVTIKNEVIVLDDHNVTVKNEVFMVNDHNVNNTATDAIVISDESDAENDNPPPRKSNIIPQWPVDIKQEQQPDGPKSSKVNHLLSSSSSSSSDEYVSVQLPVKRSRDDYNKS